MQNDSFNRGGFIAFLFSMAFSLIFFVYVSALHPGINLKEVPEDAAPAADATLAGGEAKPVAIDMAKVEKPWVEMAEVAVHGEKIYANNCAVCHGPKGLGDGPAGMSLNPRPRNLVEGKWVKGGDSIALFTTLQKGLAGTSMAAFAHIPTADRWALVQYMRAITQDKVPDDEAKLEAFAKTAK